MFALLACGCATQQTAIDPEPAVRSPAPASDIERRLRTVVDDWHGTPHVFGGTERDGLDCSAFMQVVYRTVFGMTIPRSTAQQVLEGHTVPRRQLRAGDLVFFRPERKQRHVGVYLSAGRFAHVSSSQGVTISDLDTPYWRRAYWTSRRLIGSPPVAEGRRGW